MEQVIVEPEYLIIGGAAIFSILVFFIIVFMFLYQKRLHKHYFEKQQLANSFQQELLRTQLETKEQTFHQIGEELHDNIGQLLSSTRMLIGITERSLAEVPDALRTADQTLAKAIQDLRMLSKSLNKEWLHQFNVIENLLAEVERINAAQMIHVELNSSVKSLPMDPESRVMLFRIIQEALHNSMKHSEAQNVTIEISKNHEILVIIRDDGKGFQIDQSDKQGIGLLTMKHRTSLLGGNISWNTISGNGTEVKISIPIQQ